MLHLCTTDLLRKYPDDVLREEDEDAASSLAGSDRVGGEDTDGDGVHSVGDFEEVPSVRLCGNDSHPVASRLLPDLLPRAPWDVESAEDVVDDHVFHSLSDTARAFWKAAGDDVGPDAARRDDGCYDALFAGRRVATARDPYVASLLSRAAEVDARLRVPARAVAWLRWSAVHDADLTVWSHEVRL